MKTHRLILQNDHTNQLVYVIACLIRFCNHNPLQAEQCALITHVKGHCSVFSGTFDQVFEAKSNFERVNINTEIDIYEGDMYQQQ